MVVMVVAVAKESVSVQGQMLNVEVETKMVEGWWNERWIDQSRESIKGEAGEASSRNL